jgi:hypothetical protein
LVPNRQESQVPPGQDLVGDHALVVHGQGAPVIAGQHDHVPGIGIAGILDPHLAFASHQQLDEHGQGLLGANGDDDFPGLGENPPPGQDLNPQLLQKVPVVVVDQIPGRSR